MKFLNTLLADLRERHILPAVVLLALLAIGIPIGASIELSKVTVTPPPPQPQVTVKLPKGAPTPLAELNVLNSTPVTAAAARKGVAPDPLQELGGSPTSASATPTTTPTHTTTPAKTTKPTHTTTPAKTTKPTHTTTRAKTTKPTHTTTPARTTTTPTTTTPARTTTTQTTTTPVHTTTTQTTTTPAHTTTTQSTTTTRTSTSSTHTSSSATHSTTTPPTEAPTAGPPTLKMTQAYTATIDTIDAKGKHALDNVVRLAPLPAAQSPEIIFLGILKGGKKAVFLFTNTVQVSGTSSIAQACLPSAADCQIIELGPGQGMRLAPTSNSALIATFTFTVGSIGAANFPTGSAALAARDETSSAGTALLPLSASTELSAFHFDDSVGALVYQALPPSNATGATSATGASGTSGASGATGTSGATGSTAAA